MSGTASVNKQKLYEELQLKNSLLVEGINFEPEIFKRLDVGGKVKEVVNALFARDRHAHKETEFPECIIMPEGGYHTAVRWNKGSRYSLDYQDGKFLLFNGQELINDDVKFIGRPQYYNNNTTDGTPMRTVAQDAGYGHLFVAYSNECSLKDKGKDCLFCNINATKDIYAECQNIKWKTAKQIGETIKAGYEEGNNKLTISGGFIPERREVDYYVDVAEAIREATGLEDFNGTACVGAPLDFTAFDKYKEAGYRTVATNLEVWNENLFKEICPGKNEYCGGRENWLDALDYELDVFGRFKVRSTLVSGLEPKESLLEGIEYLVSKGVIALPSQWNVNVGSALEGHRTPTEEWHWNIFERTVAIYRKYGMTWDELNDSTAEATTVAHDLFRLEEGITL